MSLIFWRKTRDLGAVHGSPVTVTEDTPLPVQIIHSDENDAVTVTIAESSKIPIGVQSALSIAASSTGLTLPPGVKPKSALIQVFTAPIRHWHNGTVPTATTGHRSDIYDTITLESPEEVSNFLAIRETGTSATLETSFYGD